MKTCPFCAEQIQDAAIKCRYCGERLDAPASADDKEAAPKQRQNLPEEIGIPHQVLAMLPSTARSEEVGARKVVANPTVRVKESDDTLATKGCATLFLAPIFCMGGFVMGLFTGHASAALGFGLIGFIMGVYVGFGTQDKVITKTFTADCPHCGEPQTLPEKQFNDLKESQKAEHCAACRNAFGVAQDGQRLEKIAIGVAVVSAEK